jgi:hypothetical protein
MQSWSTKDEQEESDQHRARYTLEFKLEAVRLVKAGRSIGDGKCAGHAQADAEQLGSAELRRVNCRAPATSR